MSTMNISMTQGRRPASVLQELLPGIVISALVASAAVGLRQASFLAPLSPVFLAILLGMFTTNIAGLPAGVGQGISFSSRTLLRLAVMLLGAQITLADILSLGLPGLLSICTIMVVTLGSTMFLGRLLGLDREISALIATGTAVCGASAIAGANGVVRAREEYVSYAVGVVTILGTICLFLYPLAKPLLGLSEAQYGFWAGLTLHEVAQAVAAGFGVSETAGQVAVTVKLGRVMLLSAVVLGLALIWARGRQDDSPAERKRPPVMPWFLGGFLILAGLNSAQLIPEGVRQIISLGTPLLMTLAMAAIGLNTRVGALASLGLQPLALGIVATLVVSGTGLALVLMLIPA